MLICSLERLQNLIAHEFNEPDFLTSKKRSEARNIYIYFSIAILNKPFKEVSKTIPFYSCNKTIYQSFRRQYEKRKCIDTVVMVNRLKNLINGG
jgi:hypothetical protein